MDERTRLRQSIGAHPVLVLRNHRLLATWPNVAEAFSLTYHFERSAEAQQRERARDSGIGSMLFGRGSKIGRSGAWICL
jgi:ribulose-5-phosphate 4-epimerase/fuculose-1-phosphate aldolase